MTIETCPHCGRRLEENDWYWVVRWPDDSVSIKGGMPRPGGTSKVSDARFHEPGRIVVWTKDNAQAEFYRLLAERNAT